MFLQKNNFYLYYIFCALLFICSVYLWAIKFYLIEARHLIILLIIPIIYNNKFNKSDFSIVLLCLIIFIHKVTIIEGNQILESLFLVFYLIILIKIIGQYYKIFLNTISDQIKLFFILIFLSSVLTSLYNFYKFNIIYSHCIIGCFSSFKFFFLENSHLGMMASSIILYSFYLYSIKNYKINIFLFLIFLIICLLNYSLTLFAGLLFNSFLILIFFWKNISRRYLTSLMLIIFFCSGIILNDKIHIVKIQSIIEPIKSKLITKSNKFTESINKKAKNNEFNHDENKNEIIVSTSLSSDVWLKSIKIASISIFKYPFGVGLNNYEIVHDKYIDNIITSFNLTRYLNIQDASINLVKIVVEFGLFSFLLFYLILKFIFSKKIKLEYKIFLLPNVLTQLLFRGAGYFNGGFLIFIIVMIFLTYKKEID